jgi:hypothetical protein
VDALKRFWPSKGVLGTADAAVPWLGVRGTAEVAFLADVGMFLSIIQTGNTHLSTIDLNFREKYTTVLFARTDDGTALGGKMNSCQRDRAGWFAGSGGKLFGAKVLRPREW